MCITIKGKKMCKTMIGYDANSLYLQCLAQKMSTGFYILLEKKNNYVQETCYSHERIQWLKHVIQNPTVRILQAENSGEVRIVDFVVDV